MGATALLPDRIRPLTLDELTLMFQPSLVSENAIREKRTLGSLGVEQPVSIVGIVPEYLEQYHPRGQFARYRRMGPLR